MFSGKSNTSLVTHFIHRPGHTIEAPPLTPLHLKSSGRGLPHFVWRWLEVMPCRYMGSTVGQVEFVTFKAPHKHFSLCNVLECSALSLCLFPATSGAQVCSWLDTMPP